jgi:hypothetical protein
LKLRSYLGKLAQIDERLFAQAIVLFCYKGILKRQHALQRQLPTLSDGVVLRMRQASRVILLGSQLAQSRIYRALPLSKTSAHASIVA